MSFVLKSFFNRSVHVSVHQSRWFSQKQTQKRARWKIVQLSCQIMRQEAQRRGAVIRDYLLSGYNVRVEIYDKSVQEPEFPVGDPLRLKHFIMEEFSDVGHIENVQIRKTHGLKLIGQMAFDVRLKDIPSVDRNYNTKTMHKLREWTSRRSDIVTVEPNTIAVVDNDKEMTAVDGDDRNVIDYVFEENDNAVGYFKEWDEPKSADNETGQKTNTKQVDRLQIARLRRRQARRARRREVE